MPREADPVDFLAREPDERLLQEDIAQLPASVGLPEPLPPPSPLRRRIVGVGAAMTGGTLVVGSVLTVAALVETISSGFGLRWVVVLIFAILLIATHWGWVHVAELTANNLDAHRNASLLARRRAWLSEIAPYPRWEVSTSAGEDGSIAIVEVCHRPVIEDDSTYTFVCEEVGRELHSADEPAAAITERAEYLRRQAAERTREAQEHYQAAHDAYEHALLTTADEQQRLAALHAASQALSERINSNLREPPLTE